jgi:3-oxoacyl-[acyl-carrier-protein] synthase-3
LQVTSGTYDTIAMNGMDVYKFATTKVPKVLKEALAQADMSADDIDWVVMHQANIRIMETVAKKLGVSMDKVITPAPRTTSTTHVHAPRVIAHVTTKCPCCAGHP